MSSKSLQQARNYEKIYGGKIGRKSVRCFMYPPKSDG